MRILIIRIGALGDVAMSTQMGFALKDHHITWLVGKQSKSIIEWAGFANEIITTDEDQLLGKKYFYKIKELARLWAVLFGRKFDLVLTAHPDLRYRLITLFCRKKEHRSFHHYPFRQMPVPGRFHGLEYLRLATGKNEPLKPYSLSAAPRNNLVLAPGGRPGIEIGKKHRMWPVENFKKLAKLLKEANQNPIIIGGPDDGWLKPHFKEYRCEIGTFSMEELIAFFETCKLTIAHDSGSIHFARLGGSPILGLFGPTIPEQFMNLNGEGPKEFAIWGGAHLPCRPCYDGRRYDNCSRNECLLSITPETVFEKAMSILNEENSPHPRLAREKLRC